MTRTCVISVGLFVAKHSGHLSHSCCVPRARMALRQTSPSPAPSGAVPAQQPLTGAAAQGKGAAPCQHPNPQLPHLLSRLPWLPSLPCHLLTGCSLHFQSAARDISPCSGLYSAVVLPLGADVVLPSVLTALVGPGPLLMRAGGTAGEMLGVC